MAERASVGGGMSSGFGASQFGGLQTLPSGVSVWRRNWQVARAMLTPPTMYSASITLIRRPSRIGVTFTSAAERSGSRYMSMVKRAGIMSGSPYFCSIACPSSPATTRPCSDVGLQGPRLIGVG
jgi:hypothetical protein